MEIREGKVMTGDDFFNFTFLAKVASLVDKALSEGQHQTFRDYYLTLKYSIFWPYLRVGIIPQYKSLSILITKGNPNNGNWILNEHRDWLVKKLEFIAKVSAMAYFDIPKKEIGAWPLMGLEETKNTILVQAMPKTHLIVKDSIIDLILSYAEKITDIPGVPEVLPICLTLSWLNSLPVGLRHHPLIKVDSEINNHPVCKKLKDRLVKKKIITSDYKLNFPYTFADVRRELQTCYLQYMMKYNPHRCPVCGSKYVELKKNQATCGKASCKQFKSSMKQAIKAIIKEKQINLATMSDDDFYHNIVQQWNDLRKKRCKGKRPKKIFSLKELSRIILKELQQ